MQLKKRAIRMSPTFNPKLDRPQPGAIRRRPEDFNQNNNLQGKSK